jgi:hypothetical protein
VLCLDHVEDAGIPQERAEPGRVAHILPDRFKRLYKRGKSRADTRCVPLNIRVENAVFDQKPAAGLEEGDDTGQGGIGVRKLRGGECVSSASKKAGDGTYMDKKEARMNKVVRSDLKRDRL